MIEIFERIPPETIVFSGVAIVACVTVIIIVLIFSIRMIIMGYPVVEQQDCNNENNLSGSCLLKNNCKTSNQCEAICNAHHF